MSEKIFSKANPINKAIEIIELRSEELEDDIESVRLWWNHLIQKMKFHLTNILILKED